MIWDTLNSTIRLLITAAIVWQMFQHYLKYNWLERFGMSLAGSCSLLTVTVIWQQARSPFDGWATSLFSIGVLMYIVGVLSRDYWNLREESSKAI